MAKVRPQKKRSKEAVVKAILHDLLDHHHFETRGELIEALKYRCARTPGIVTDSALVASAVEHVAHVRRDVPDYDSLAMAAIQARQTFYREEVQEIGRREAAALLDKLMNSPRTSAAMRQCLIAGLKTIPSAPKGV